MNDYWAARLQGRRIEEETGLSVVDQAAMPLGSFRIGHGLEHEPIGQAERMTQRTAQTTAKGEDNDRAGPQIPAHAVAGQQVRAAMRGGL